MGNVGEAEERAVNFLEAANDPNKALASAQLKALIGIGWALVAIARKRA